MPKEGEVQSCGIYCGAAPAARSWQHNVGELEPKQQGEAVAEELDGETPLSLHGGGGSVSAPEMCRESRESSLTAVDVRATAHTEAFQGAPGNTNKEVQNH